MFLLYMNRMPNLFIASGGADAAFKIWDISSGAVVFNVMQSCPITSLCFFPDDTGIKCMNVKFSFLNNLMYVL